MNYFICVYVLLFISLTVSSAQVAVYGQCGGQYYTGNKSCVSGATCVKQNDWYSQCLPSSTPQSPSPSPAAQSPISSPVSTSGRNIYVATNWKDVNGNPLHAHGGQIIQYQGTYYWYGETDKADYTNKGVNVYSSPDLLKWTLRGTPVRASDINSGMGGSSVSVVERPKVLYNPNTKKFVMYIHVDTSDYSLASVGVFTSSSPTGPFTYVRVMRPNGNESRDMGVFLDDDGTPYIMYASGHVNTGLTISTLSSDWTNYGTVQSTITGGLESPTIMKGNGGYYLFLSKTTGWSPNPGILYWASSLKGPWWDNGQLGPNNTYNSQPTFLLPLVGSNGKTKYVYMGDRWNHPNLKDATYVWLRLKIQPAGVQPGVVLIPGDGSGVGGATWDLDSYLNES
ncbi:hypothetical protein HK098_004720 [Nowakowskiella sp. JEL0407]|nr:hypothetical protein HK098_004720 [Nowakowskiella sp. JEL0407]